MSSEDRVLAAAADLGLAIELQTLPSSTRTAEEAASACGCTVAEIVKTLVFELRSDEQGIAVVDNDNANEHHVSSRLVILLVSGGNRVNTDGLREAVQGELSRADPKRVRSETGFAIGGVAPIGHVNPIRLLMDRDLLQYGRVWASGGGPNTVFAVSPAELQRATSAQVVAMN